MATPAHASKVRSLYKRILVLHRFLPIELKTLGDQYVKDEFRRHKRATGGEVRSFMEEWEVRGGGEGGSGSGLKEPEFRLSIFASASEEPEIIRFSLHSKRELKQQRF